MLGLTFAPLPSLNVLLHALFHKPLSDDDLAAPWCRKGDKGIWVSRSTWSLRIIAEWRATLTKKDVVTVWVPDYFCNASLLPMREYGVKFVFYPINGDLSPDIIWCRNNLQFQKPDLYILVHYFGQPNQITEVSDLCKENGTWLIEDATHVLQPIKGVGEYGDCVIYSPHKHLAIPDGALLVMRNSKSTMLGDDSNSPEILKNISKKFIYNSNRTTTATIVWLVKRILQMSGLRGKMQQAPFWPDLDYTCSYFNYKQMSRLARKLLSIYIRELTKIADLRKKNWLNWRLYLSPDNVGIDNFKPLQMNETPYMAAFCIEDFEKATLCYDRFRMKKLPVSSWPDLPAEVLNNSLEHKCAIHMRKSRLYLSVNQSLYLDKKLKKQHVSKRLINI